MELQPGKVPHRKAGSEIRAVSRFFFALVNGSGIVVAHYKSEPPKLQMCWREE